jgi:hypothetical protein
MKKHSIILLIVSFLAVLFISSCNPSHVSPVAITSAFGTTGCQTGPVACTGGVPWTVLNGNGVINSQAEYDAAYHGWAPGTDPTPTPVPVDFTKNTIVCMRVVWDCGSAAPGFTGFSTDCSAVYLNQADWVDCYAGTFPKPICNSVFSMYFTYLIDKTTLPVMVKTDVTQCDGTIKTYINPL